MFVGLVHPKAYIENGRRSSWTAAHILIIVVSIILPLCIFFIPVNKKLGHDIIADKIDEKISDFSITDNGFYCEKKYEWASDGSYILINTSRESASQDEIDELLEIGGYRTMIIANSKEIYMYSDNSANVFKWDSIYKYLQSIDNRQNYNKTLALSILRKYDTPVIAGATVAMFLAMVLGYYICSLLWGILGSVMASFMNKKLHVSEMMKAAIYIRTPWYIIRKVAGVFLVTALSRLLWTGAFIIIFIYIFIAISKFDSKKSRIKPEENMKDNNADNAMEYYGE
jgi:hypothetical protein